MEDQQAYDRGTTIFSPDGRLYQVEYAREAVGQGAPVVGVRGGDAVVLAAAPDAGSPLVETDSIEKLHRVDAHLAVGTAGHAADARRLVDIARQTAQEERVRYEEPMAADALATALADHVQERTQTGGARPYGTALLVAGNADGPTLVEVDPSGATREWRANALGDGAPDAQEHLEATYEDGLAAEDAEELALDALDAAVGDDHPTETVTVTAAGAAFTET
ncbi:archaeal proteasome endopeptidase complex subunit alpha [Salarchaeum sp. JOR-1]|uniref:archaeal proteasome endopeptidase complex subunit alpha n=1 Tax=Salarchaeum sp. JOR-1 TaxID=2599399 RepID=UPI0011984C2D|nr:archaeal proteasome endopeptidase complex subunit alpha [Salarchaeum sp. JOR-1]QDX40603.1 archaeal proteasome endopeptidase complex subunit alpha [Salarchaeum sp. JOR-1]